MFETRKLPKVGELVNEAADVFTLATVVMLMVIIHIYTTHSST